MTQMSCPNCGDLLNPKLSHVKMVSCASCSSTVMVEDAVTKLAGDQGVMHDTPLLFQIGDHIALPPGTIEILGHARFSYGRGFWDEFWGVAHTGQDYWLSIDEGDIFLQSPVPQNEYPKYNTKMKVGDQIEFQRDTYVITEMESAACVALRGSFGEVLSVGETYEFINATTPDGDYLSGEFQNRSAWFVGSWLDPYELPLRVQS